MIPCQAWTLCTNARVAGTCSKAITNAFTRDVIRAFGYHYRRDPTCRVSTTTSAGIQLENPFSLAMEIAFSVGLVLARGIWKYITSPMTTPMTQIVL